MLPFFESEGRGFNSLRARCSNSARRLEILSRSDRPRDRFSVPCSTNAANGVAPAAVLTFFELVCGGSGNIAAGAIELIADRMGAWLRHPRGRSQ